MEKPNLSKKKSIMVKVLRQDMFKAHESKKHNMYESKSATTRDTRERIHEVER